MKKLVRITLARQYVAEHVSPFAEMQFLSQHAANGRCAPTSAAPRKPRLPLLAPIIRLGTSHHLQYDCWVARQRWDNLSAVGPGSSASAGTEKATSNGDQPPLQHESGLADYQHPVGVEDFRKMGYEMIDMICDYYSGLGSVPVKPTLQVNSQSSGGTAEEPGYLRSLLPASPPEEAQPFADVMRDVKGTIMPGVVHWQSPNFFAYFAANSSFPGMLAEMLMTATNMIGFSWAASPVSTELEMAMMDWLAELCGLPDRFRCNGGAGPGGGVIQGTTSDAVVVALLAAKARALRGRPAEDALKLVAYASDQAHSCFRKACMVAGIKHIRDIPTTAASQYALRPEDLEASMRADAEQGLIPCYVCATIGTTSSCAVDPVGQMVTTAQQYGAWVHVDAAYAGAAALLPDQRAAHFGGLGGVDSYSFNPHKWLLVNFDCCAMWVADSGPLKEALSLTPVFLQGAGNALDYKDWQIPLGRRFRSLKLYFVLRMYGAERLRAYLRHHIALAAHFAELVRADPRFEVVEPQRFGLVCFRLRGVPNAVNEALLAAVNAPPGNVFLIHTVLSGQHTLRLAVGSATTQLRHVEAAWAHVACCAEQVLAAHGAAEAEGASAATAAAASGRRS